MKALLQLLSSFIALAGVERIIITATNLQEARNALALAKTDGALPPNAQMDA